MKESEFIALADATLERISDALERSAVECDCESKAGGVLEIEFGDGSRIVVNRQFSAQELWVAAKSGGYHFRWDGEKWIDTRDASELFAALSELVSRQSGQTVTLR
jgi:CyaY protein